MNQLLTVNEINDTINNSIVWIKDSILWRKKDYWATPKETLDKKAGDCEDFAIIKYFHLIDCGIDEDKLYITYVKYQNIAHMVLCYYDGEYPYILDNINQDLKLSTDRKDLKSVYGFNSKNVIIIKHFKKDNVIQSPNKMKLWVDLLKRIKVYEC